MTVAAVCCCQKIKKAGPQIGNRPLTCVELRGFEPLTPSMRTRCATGLRYSPENKRQPSKLCGLLAPRDCGVAGEWATGSMSCAALSGLRVLVGERLAMSALGEYDGR